MNLQEMLKLAGNEIRSAMDELEKRGIKICHVDVVIEPPVVSAEGAAEYVRTINARMTPNDPSSATATDKAAEAERKDGNS